MIKEIVHVELNQNFKDKALEIINETIEYVMDVHGMELDNKTINKIKNLSLDQVNVNVTTRANLKTLWIINVEESLPLVVEKEDGSPKLSELVKNSSTKGIFKMKPNLTWTFKKDNIDNGGIDKESFEDKAREMLLEDVETAAFYGALSYTGDSNEY